ncbi:MAG: hypothetical protein QXU20_03675 [Candidatus Woesearchaeota archaeon]
MKHDIFFNIKTKIEQSKLPFLVTFKKVPGTLKDLVTDIEKELSKITSKRRSKELTISPETYERIKQNLTEINKIANIQNIQTEKRKKKTEEERQILGLILDTFKDIAEVISTKNPKLKEEKKLVEDEYLILRKSNNLFTQKVNKINKILTAYKEISKITQKIIEKTERFNTIITKTINIIPKVINKLSSLSEKLTEKTKKIFQEPLLKPEIIKQATQTTKEKRIEREKKLLNQQSQAIDKIKEKIIQKNEKIKEEINLIKEEKNLIGKINTVYKQTINHITQIKKILEDIIKLQSKILARGTMPITATKKVLPESILAIAKAIENENKLLNTSLNVFKKSSDYVIKAIEKENALLKESKKIFQEINNTARNKNREINKEKELIKEEKNELQEVEHILDNFTFLLDILSLKLFLVGFSLSTIGNNLINTSRSILYFINSIIQNTEELLLIQRRLSSLFSNLDKDILQGERILDILNKMAVETVYETTELAEAFTQFKAIGLENQRIFELTIDTATAFGLKVSQIADDIARALEGDATAFKNLRHSIGLTNQNIAKFGGALDKSGRLILSNTEALDKNRQAVIKYLEQYSGIAEKTIGTLPQQIKNLKDALIILQKEFVKSLQFIGDLAQKIAMLILKFKDMNELLKITITTTSTWGALLTAITLFIGGTATKSIGDFLILLSYLGTSISVILATVVYLYRNLTLFKDIPTIFANIVTELIKIGALNNKIGKTLINFITNFKDFLIKGLQILTNFRLLITTLLTFATKIFLWLMRTIGIYFIIINLALVLHNYLKSIQESHKKISTYIEEQTKQYFQVLAAIKGISKEKIILVGLAEDFANKNKEVIDLLNIYNNRLEFTKELFEKTNFEAEQLLDLFFKINKTLLDINKNLTIESVKEFKNSIKTILSQAIELDYIKPKTNFIENFFGDSKKLEKELEKINEDLTKFVQELDIKTKGTSQELIKNLEENKIKVIQKLKEMEKEVIQAENEAFNKTMTFRNKKLKEMRLKELKEEIYQFEEKIKAIQETLRKYEKEAVEKVKEREKLYPIDLDPEEQKKFKEINERLAELSGMIFYLRKIEMKYHGLIERRHKEILSLTKEIDDLNKKIETFQDRIELIQKNFQNKIETTEQLFKKAIDEIHKQEMEYYKTLENIQRNITSYILKDLTSKAQKEIKDFITNFKKDLTSIKEINISDDIIKVRKNLEEINKTRQKLLDIEEKIKNTTDISKQNTLLLEYNNLLYKENELIKEQETLFKNITIKTQELIDNLKEMYKIQSLITKLKFIGIEDKEIDKIINKNINKLLQQIDKLKETEVIALFESLDLNIKQLNKEEIERILAYKKSSKEIKQTLKDIIQTEITVNEILDRFQTRIQELKPNQIFQEVNLLIKDTSKYLQNNLYLTQNEVKLIQKIIGLENLRIKLLEQINTKELKIKEAEEILSDLEKEISKENLDRFKLKDIELKYIQKIQNTLYSLPYLTDIYKQKIQDIIKEKQKEIKQIEEEIEDYKELARLLENIKISEKEISKLKIDTAKLRKAREEIKKEETEEKRIIFFSKAILEDIYQEALEKTKELMNKEIKNILQAQRIEVDIIQNLKELMRKGIKFNKEDIYNFWKEGKKIYKEFLLELKNKIDDLKKEIEEIFKEEETEKIPTELRKFYDIANKAIEIGKQAGNERLTKLGETLKRSITQQSIFSTPLKEPEEVFKQFGQSYQITLTKSIQEEINKLNTQIEENIKKASEDFLKSSEMFSDSVNKFDQTVQFLTNNLKTITPKPTHTNTNWILKQLLTP